MTKSTDSKKIALRCEIAAEHKWSVEDLYTDENVWQNDCQAIHDMLPLAAQFKEHLADSAQMLADFMHYQEKAGRLLDKVYLYASMKLNEDNGEAHYQAMQDRAQKLAVELSNALSFAQPEILSIPEAKLDKYLKKPVLQKYQRYFTDITRMRKHTLSAKEEQILALSGEMAGSYNHIFSMLNNVDLDFGEITNEEDQKEQLSHGNYLRFMESSQRSVRKEAFQTLYGAYEKHKNTLAGLYASSVKKDVFYARVRNYESARAGSLFADNISLDVYDNLLKTVREGQPVFARYLDLRKRLLDLEELHMYDIYAPLFGKSQQKYSYPKACVILQKALAPLGEDYISVLQEGLSGGWVDIYENKGKTSGAYSSGIYDSKPYILLNYQDNLNSVFTLAHEAGHSMHSYYSHQKQPYVYAYYRIFVAEVASTVNENLLTAYLLQQAADQKEKKIILNNYLDDFRGTVFRQTMFAEFEKITHEIVEEGQSLTAETLSDIYYQLNRDYFGQEMFLDEQIKLEWARIPHFYRAFYVYKYATGFSAATALATGLLDPDPQIAQKNRQKYLEFLSGGDSRDPLDLLAAAGVDMRSPEPVSVALQMFQKRLEELISLS
ncbi:MAG: oligoendopeptidase F [Bacillota bacterium]